jgi:predicted nucleotidyltransferase
MQFPRDLVEMLSAFEDARVRYLVIGGHAVGVHARPRSTKDLDVWLDPERKNIGRACDALLAFGVPVAIADALRTARRDEIVWMGRAPARVDFLLTIPGATFESAWRRRVAVVVDGVTISVIGREDLLANKRAVGRPQDLRDVRAIERGAGNRARGKA